MRYLRRYDDGERMAHWAVALLFFAAGLSGLALLHPAFFFFTNLFGGGMWSRILHPFFGVAMALGFAFLFVKMWRHNGWDESDTRWARSAGSMLRGDKSNMPPVGRYNAGQKAVFWLMSASLLVLLATGFMFWQPWFAPAFPIPVRRIAILLHAVAGTALILGIIVHVYAAIWVRGTMRAMTRGSVSEAWARYNHPLWHREVAAAPTLRDADGRPIVRR